MPGFDWSEFVNPIETNGRRQTILYPHQGATDKVPYLHCTNYVGATDDHYGLCQWKQQKLARGLALRHDYYTAVCALTLDDGQQLNGIIEDAKKAAEADYGSTVGTALHRFTEHLDLDRRIDTLPIEYTADLAAYAEATAPLKMLHVEPFLVCDPLMVCGTPDRIFEYGGKRYIGDVKTGKIEDGIDKIAQQLALYARSALYNHDTGERTPHGASTQRGLIIHLPAGTGTCELVWVDIREGWNGVMLSKAVHARRKLRFKHLTVSGLDNDDPFQSRPTPDPLPIDNLLSVINAATTARQLRVLWQSNPHLFQPHHVEAAKARIASLDTQIPAAAVAAGVQ